MRCRAFTALACLPFGKGPGKLSFFSLHPTGKQSLTLHSATGRCAVELLSSYVNENMVTVTIASMVLNGLWSVACRSRLLRPGCCIQPHAAGEPVHRPKQYGRWETILVCETVWVAEGKDDREEGGWEAAATPWALGFGECETRRSAGGCGGCRVKFVLDGIDDMSAVLPWGARSSGSWGWGWVWGLYVGGLIGVWVWGLGGLTGVGGSGLGILTGVGVLEV